MQYPVNVQPPEGRAKPTNAPDGSQLLDVQSIFYTIQGEGPFTGTPAVFIRLAGCNLQCPGCDTDYTSLRNLMSVEAVLSTVMFAHVYGDVSPGAYQPGEETIAAHRYRGLVVITGGEPFRQELDTLVEALITRLGCYVQIETNGTLNLTVKTTYLSYNTLVRQGCYIVVSPKASQVSHFVDYWACAYKYVLDSEHVADDGLPSIVLNHTLGKNAPNVARPSEQFLRSGRPVYLQPMDSRNLKQNERNLQACVKSCMKHGYILQLQVHKILHME